MNIFNRMMSAVLMCVTIAAQAGKHSSTKNDSYGNNVLQQYILKGDTIKVSKFLTYSDMGSCITALEHTNKKGDTPLHTAARLIQLGHDSSLTSNKSALLEILLAHICSIEPARSTNENKGKSNKQNTLLYRLLRMPGAHGETPLEQAIQSVVLQKSGALSGTIGAIKILLRFGASMRDSFFQYMYTTPRMNIGDKTALITICKAYNKHMANNDMQEKYDADFLVDLIIHCQNNQQFDLFLSSLDSFSISKAIPEKDIKEINQDFCFFEGCVDNYERLFEQSYSDQEKTQLTWKYLIDDRLGEFISLIRSKDNPLYNRDTIESMLHKLDYPYEFMKEIRLLASMYKTQTSNTHVK